MEAGQPAAICYTYGLTELKDIYGLSYLANRNPREPA